MLRPMPNQPGDLGIGAFGVGGGGWGGPYPFILKASSSSDGNL